MTNQYGIGARVRIETDEPFRDLDGTPTDPSTVTVEYWKPSGTLTSSTSPSSGASTGHFYLDITTDEAGTWFYKFKGTGSLIAAPIRNGKFIVNADQA